MFFKEKIAYHIHIFYIGAHYTAGEGNMKVYSPKSTIFPEVNTRGEYDTRGRIHFSYFLNPHAINVLLYQMKPNV
jgi:hypothetical protein